MKLDTLRFKCELYYWPSRIQ